MGLYEIKYDIKKGTGHLEFDKMKTVQCAANLYTWIMETEERVLIETLALNGGEIALKRWRKVINKALKMAAEVNKGKGENISQHDKG